ncbi:hypothetical protein PF003_g10087 [Phytophthora fragariae]|nr:hypothetical protein PF003_g10087 [Phytophthora fragariae]
MVNKLVEGADSALTDPTIVVMVDILKLKLVDLLRATLLVLVNINDVLMSSSEENDNVESESADEEEVAVVCSFKKASGFI